MDDYDKIIQDYFKKIQELEDYVGSLESNLLNVCRDNAKMKRRITTLQKRIMRLVRYSRLRYRIRRMLGIK